jgi:hypothetical protein
MADGLAADVVILVVRTVFPSGPIQVGRAEPGQDRMPEPEKIT